MCSFLYLRKNEFINKRRPIFNLFVAQVVVIKGHDGLVKGVTWDPVGKYLASQVKS